MKKLLFYASLLGSMFVNGQTYLGSVVLSSAGTVPISLDVEVNLDTAIVNFTFSGPSSMYYAVGFDAGTMADAPYIFLTQESTVQERKLTGGRSAGDLLNPEITMISDNVDANDMRTIAFSRALTVADSNYFDFSTIEADTALDLIWAEGASQNIVRHTRRGNTSITFVEDTTLSVNDISRSDSSFIQLYPNPVETFLNVDNYDKLSSIEVYDMRYSKINTYDSASLTSGKVNMEKLSSGTYIVKCIGADGTAVSEMVIKK